MSDSKTPSRFASVGHRAARVESRTVSPVAVSTNAHKTSGRHAAITNNLNNWISYKAWAQKIRDTWEENK
jgi:hypothetical protein